MSLLRAVYLICAEHSFVVTVSHIPGVRNVIADCLSRGLLLRFRALALTARHNSDTVQAFNIQY